MKKIKYFLIGFLMFIPQIVNASSSLEGSSIGVLGAIMMEAFVSIHMSVFVLKPLSEMLAKDNSKRLFWIMFGIRVGILLFFDFFVTTSIAFFDFGLVFIGAFVIVPITALITKKSPFGSNLNKLKSNTIKDANDNRVTLKCTYCGNTLDVNDKVCSKCGAPFENDNVKVIPVTFAKSSDYDSIYSNSEDLLLEEFLKKEMTKAGIDLSKKLIPSEVIKRKRILTIIFSFLVFVYLTMIFFHFPILTYLIGLIILIIFSKITKKYDLLKYLKKEVKARPNEKISNIVMNTKNSLVENNLIVLKLSGILVAIVLSLLLFIKPRILYEKVDGGYAVRYYVFGLSNFKTVSIPETYKGERVISLRGNAFSNMFLLQSVTLPDSIREIRGEAFYNDVSLKEVRLPKNLQYLGGGAFENCSSIKKVELPSTLTYLGGESFYNATSLEFINIPSGITEIRGNTFENCISLKSINIPKNVTRIAAHAFYGDISLKEVAIPSDSLLKEIGSSAFRGCDSLETITLPRDVIINERAFKESPTYIEYY